MAVVGDPFLVEVGFALVESPIDGFAVNFGGPLPVGAVELGWGRRGRRSSVCRSG